MFSWVTTESQQWNESAALTDIFFMLWNIVLTQKITSLRNLTHLPLNPTPLTKCSPSCSYSYFPRELTSQSGKIPSRCSTEKPPPPTWKRLIFHLILCLRHTEQNRTESNAVLWLVPKLNENNTILGFNVSDVFCLSLMRNTKRLTKGRLACVYSWVKETRWAARLLHVESQPHVSEFKNGLWS